MFALGPERVKRHLPALVVAGWGLVNGPFLAVLAIRGESALFYRLWGGAVLVLELFAVAVLLSSRTGPGQHVRHTVPDREAGAVLPAASGPAGLFVHGRRLLVTAVPLLGEAAAMTKHGTTVRER
ncbi:hypothetical protein [Streptomyces collinus]|uniref:hypothetical protein n=1 Tax=Streptomyces collinus TaxID=42684 RepID=UPI0036EB7ABC